MIRGKLALMPAMSRIRPACPPMNTKPSWMRIGNRTRSGTDTHGADPPRATTQAMPIPTAAPPSTTTASPTRSNRAAVRATAPDTAIPATPITMYVAGSHPAP